MLTSALEHYRRQQRIGAAALIAARGRRAKGSLAVAQLVAGFQLVAARDALSAVPRMLDEQGLDAPPVAEVNPVALVGVASDGRPLETLFDQAETDHAFGLMVVTQMQDVARAASGLSITTRPGVSGYIRMLNPPSCSRCAVLAGRFYRWNEGFQRHPRCDCRHVPSGDEQMARDLGLVDNPNDYFHGLPKAEQDRIFTARGAEAVRDGADVSQVVNARRGMSMAGSTQTTTRVINGETHVVNVTHRSLTPTQVGGRGVFTSTEGTTKRGAASRARTGRNQSQRLMPETIYQVAVDRADAIRLLQLNGYLI